MTLPRTPSLRVDGKRALVTGGTRGIGLGAAVALAEAGAAVTIVARTPDDVACAGQLMRTAGLTVEGAVLDVTDVEAVQTFVDGSETYDILVNSAGMARHAEFVDVTVADYRAVLDLNLGAALFVSQAVSRRLIADRKPGSIIHVSSQMGHVGGPRRAVYAASKHALEGLSKAMALELGAHGIRVNTIAPTFIETDMTAAGLGEPAFRSWVLSKIKLGRLGRVEDIMGPVVFLASDAAALVTGVSLLVDGGWTAE